jgi:hypothetical protein
VASCAAALHDRIFVLLPDENKHKDRSAKCQRAQDESFIMAKSNAPTTTTNARFCLEGMSLGSTDYVRKSPST